MQILDGTPDGVTYLGQEAFRKAHGMGAKWYTAETGCTTLFHVDLNKRMDAAIGTNIYLARGKMVVIVWDANELSLTSFHKSPHWVEAIAILQSLCVVVVREGHVLRLEKDVVHMVVTLESKAQLAWHF